MLLWVFVVEAKVVQHDLGIWADTSGMVWLSTVQTIVEPLKFDGIIDDKWSQNIVFFLSQL